MAFQMILHEGVVGPELHPKLAAGIRRIYAGIFAATPEEVAVDVNEIPAGRFFTAAKPSRSSIVAGSVPAGTSREDRTRFLSEVTEFWCRVTGCTSHEIVVSASDAAPLPGGEGRPREFGPRIELGGYRQNLP